jgi:eukaryotic-like serine/threonine-protein kinase
MTEDLTTATRPPPEQYGRYRLIERIGRGGMAEVFRAYVEGIEGFQNTFVIKRIRPEKSDSPEFVDLFCNEARICALLHHPNIVEVYDFGQIGTAYFMAMEYLRGRDLAAVMRALRVRHGSVPPAVAAHVARQVAQGLHHAHEATFGDGRAAEIVHRDVTPSNIMLLRAGGVKVLDFGIAKAAETARPVVAQKGRVKGKLAYLSPEQVRNGELDGRSDVFSLGVVLWEMLAGQRLFAADSEFQTLRNVLTVPVPPPSSKRPEVPAAIEAVVARALERRPEARYPSAGAMADALGHALGVVVPGVSEDALEAGVRGLLAELFGEDGGHELPERFTSSFASQSVSSPEPASALAASGPAADAPVGPSVLAEASLESSFATVDPVPLHRRGWVLGLVAAVAALAWVATCLLR